MALIGLVVTIPVFMFVFLLILRKRVSVAVDSKNPLAEKDAIDKPARAVITLSVENRSRLFPVTKGIARVRYENPFSGDKGKLKIRFSVDTGKTVSVRLVNRKAKAVENAEMQVTDKDTVLTKIAGKAVVTL